MQPEPEPVDTAIGASVALGTPGHAVNVVYHFQMFLLLSMTMPSELYITTVIMTTLLTIIMKIVTNNNNEK
jgi:hypothetical protein